MKAGQLLGGRYELRRAIGRGGMGEVWVGRDRMLDRDVALKVLDVHAAHDDGVAAERFRRETTAAAGLSHPHVVQVFDGGVTEGIAYLVMELLPGPTLAELVAAEGPLPVDRAVALARQAADGLAAVHRAGLVHRDVMPSNLMLDEQGRVRVVDFGIARLAEATATQVTATGTVIGSAAYLSPEQARGEAATPASDHYALGCVLMTMLTGRPPYEAEHPMALLRQHIDSAPPRVRDRRPEVPAAVDRLVDTLLSKDPRRRSAGVGALLALPGAAANAVLPAADAGAAPPPTPTAVLTSTTPGVVAPPGRSPRVLVVLGAVLLALLVVLLLAMALTAGGDDDPEDTAAPPSTSASDRPPATDDETTPPTTAAASPTTEQTTEPPANDLDGALDDLAAAIERTRAYGGLEEKAADELLRKVDELRKHVDEGKPEHVVKKLDDLSKKVDDLLEKGEIDAAGATVIRDAIDGVRAAL